jgi:hypothetical protein
MSWIASRVPSKKGKTLVEPCGPWTLAAFHGTNALRAEKLRHSKTAVATNHARLATGVTGSMKPAFSRVESDIGNKQPNNAIPDAPGGPNYFYRGGVAPAGDHRDSESEYGKTASSVVDGIEGDFCSTYSFGRGKGRQRSVPAAELYAFTAIFKAMTSVGRRARPHQVS